MDSFRSPPASGHGTAVSTQHAQLHLVVGLRALRLPVLRRAHARVPQPPDAPPTPRPCRRRRVSSFRSRYDGKFGARWGTGGAAARGTEIHAILAEIDFRGPNIPLGMPADVRPLIAQFSASSTFRRLASRGDRRREQGFAVTFGELADHRHLRCAGARPADRRRPGQIDYKSDRLGDAIARRPLRSRYRELRRPAHHLRTGRTAQARGSRRRRSSTSSWSVPRSRSRRSTPSRTCRRLKLIWLRGSPARWPATSAVTQTFDLAVSPALDVRHEVGSVFVDA